MFKNNNQLSRQSGNRFWGSIIAGLLSLSLSAQTSSVFPPIARQVDAAKSVSGPLYRSASVLYLAPVQQEPPVPGATLLTLSPEEARKLWKKRPAQMAMSIPVSGGEQPLELELILQSPLAESFRVTTSKGATVSYEPAACYRGIVRGQPQALVALSITQDEIIGVISTPDKGNLVLGRLNQPGNRTGYILYSDKQLPVTRAGGCAALVHADYAEKMMQLMEQGKTAAKAPAKCVRIHLECDYALYQSKGSVAATADYITALFNNVAALYANEGVTVVASEVLIWTTPDGLPTDDPVNALFAFRAIRPSFNGDLAHLAALGGQDIGGAAWTNGLCNDTVRYGYNNISGTYQAVPTYSWDVHCLAHEIGHSLGSPHTHACWGSAALDNCYPVEGNCNTGPSPVNGGTIMSYCHLTSGGVNFSNGFGQRPGDLIRNNLVNSSCLSLCGDVGEDYCISRSFNSSREYLNRVTLAGMDHTSGNNGGYGDFTSIAATLVPGTTDTIRMWPIFATPTPLPVLGWRVWIDYNHDLDFSDPGEMVGYALTYGTAGIAKIGFTIPPGLSGSTRMRVGMRFGPYPFGPCDILAYGEIEDYTVIFNSTSQTGYMAGQPMIAEPEGLIIFPNPATDQLNLRWYGKETEEITFTLFDLKGQKVYTANIISSRGQNNRIIPVKLLAPGQYLALLQGNSLLYRQKVAIKP